MALSNMLSQSKWLALKFNDSHAGKLQRYFLDLEALLNLYNVVSENKCKQAVPLAQDNEPIDDNCCLNWQHKGLLRVLDWSLLTLPWSDWGLYVYHPELGNNDWALTMPKLELKILQSSMNLLEVFTISRYLIGKRWFLTQEELRLFFTGM